MRLTLLGTGTSMGVPQIGCGCVVCRSTDFRDQRTRTSAVIESGATRLLIDTPPELRLQLLRANIHRVDAVLYTHQHADHVHGIDDLRSFSIQRRGTLPLFGSADLVEHLRTGFRYIFDDQVVPIDGTSKPRLTLHPLQAGRLTEIAGLDVLPLGFEHGKTTVFGYRVGPVAYITDIKRVPLEARTELQGVRVLVLSALWWREHPTHLSIGEAVETALAIGAEHTYLTHLTHETGHRDLLSKLPAGIEPGYDGLQLEIPE